MIDVAFFFLWDDRLHNHLFIDLLVVPSIYPVFEAEQRRWIDCFPTQSVSQSAHLLINEIYVGLG